MKKNKIMMGVGILIGLTLTGCGEKEIDLNDYVVVTYDGMDTKGSAVASFDEELGDVIRENVDRKSDEAKNKAVSRLYDGLEVSLDQSDALSNGDSIKIDVEYDNDVAKKYGVKFNFKEMTAEVSGLQEMKKLSTEDLFADVVVEFSGVSPNASVAISNKSSDALVKNIKFEAQSPYDLKKGDEVVIRADISEVQAEAAGYLIDEDYPSKSYTVDNVDEYVTSYEQLNQDFINSLVTNSIDIVSADITKDYMFKKYAGWKESPDKNTMAASDMHVEKAYFLYLKDGMYEDEKNGMMMQVTYNAADKDNPGTNTKVMVYFPNIILEAGGELKLDIMDAEVVAYSPIEDNLYRDAITSKKAEYDIEEVAIES